MSVNISWDLSFRTDTNESYQFNSVTYTPTSMQIDFTPWYTRDPRTDAWVCKSCGSVILTSHMLVTVPLLQSPEGLNEYLESAKRHVCANNGISVGR